MFSSIIGVLFTWCWNTSPQRVRRSSFSKKDNLSSSSFRHCVLYVQALVYVLLLNVFGSLFTVFLVSFSYELLGCKHECSFDKAPLIIICWSVYSLVQFGIYIIIWFFVLLCSKWFKVHLISTTSVSVVSLWTIHYSI